MKSTCPRALGRCSLVASAYVAVMNWACVIVSLRNRKRGIDRHHSTVPLVSALLALFGFILYPRPEKIWIFLIPLLDIANWALLALPVLLIRESRKKNEEEK